MNETPRPLVTDPRIGRRAPCSRGDRIIGYGTLQSTLQDVLAGARRGPGAPAAAPAADRARYRISWTPRAFMFVPDPMPGPTVPVVRMSVNRPTRHDVAPLPVLHSAPLSPWM